MRRYRWLYSVQAKLSLTRIYIFLPFLIHQFKLSSLGVLIECTKGCTRLPLGLWAVTGRSDHRHCANTSFNGANEESLIFVTNDKSIYILDFRYSCVE